MKKRFLLIVLWCEMSAAFWGSSLTEKLDAYMSQIDDRCMVAVEIQDMDSGKIVYQKNSLKLMKPASLQKIPTALVALSKLGSTYRFETSLHKKGCDLYLQFAGDPTFRLKDLGDLFKSYRKKSGSVISGNIVVGEHTTPPFPYKDGWTVEAVRFKYGAPISAININKNVICLRFVPGATEKQRPTVIYDPDQPSYKIDNQSISKICLEEEYLERCDLDLEENLTIKGCVPLGGAAFKICLPVKDHRFKEYVRKCIQSALREVGVELRGKIIFKVAKLDPNSVLIARHFSEPLFQILKTGMKNSDNTIMESLLLPIMLKTPHAFRKSDYLHKFMTLTLKEGLGVDMEDQLLMDGSGLSHHNLISAHKINELLYKAYQNKSFQEAFVASLAVGGLEGTLQNHFKSLPKGIKIVGKTGTLGGVCNIAGYVFAGEKTRYIFTIMMQNFVGEDTAYIDLQEKIVLSLTHLLS
ncbi:MAG: D-alanyl-D-alanine carboxypeptidase/D-alanyl-D-alanine-endopeptidase [Alphaproteobacteria bacterium]